MLFLALFYFFLRHERIIGKESPKPLSMLETSLSLFFWNIHKILLSSKPAFLSHNNIAWVKTSKLCNLFLSLKLTPSSVGLTVDFRIFHKNEENWKISLLMKMKAKLSDQLWRTRIQKSQDLKFEVVKALQSLWQS